VVYEHWGAVVTPRWGGCETQGMVFATHADLTGRLRGLVILLGERLRLDQARFVEELMGPRFVAAWGVAPHTTTRERTA